MIGAGGDAVCDELTRGRWVVVKLSQVLVVDDDAEMRRLISNLLKPIGLQSVLVKDGKAALALLSEGLVPSLVILDLMMPEMDGFEVLARIRAMRSMDSVPVLILSAHAEPDAIRRGLDGGADGYVTKTYLTSNLIDRVRVLVAAGRQPQPKTRFYGRTSPLGAQFMEGLPPPAEPPAEAPAEAPPSPPPDADESPAEGEEGV